MPERSPGLTPASLAGAASGRDRPGGAGQRDDRPVSLEVTVPAAAAMRELGRRLASLLRSGDLVVLAGPLGAGKTTLVQGIGEGLAVRGPITSPTFVIARVHPSLRGGPDLVHADAYRLGSRLEVDDLDLDTDLDHCVTVVEWGEGLVEDLAPARMQITIGWATSGPGPEQGSASQVQPQEASQVQPREESQVDAGPEAEVGPLAGRAPERIRASEPGPGQPGDEPRLVVVAGYGDRWRGAADSLRGILAESSR